MAIKAVTEQEMIIPATEVAEALATNGEGEEPVPVATVTMYQQLDLVVKSRQEQSEELVKAMSEVLKIDATIQGYKNLISYEKENKKPLELKIHDLMIDLEIGQQRLGLEVTINEASEDDGIDTSELDDLDDLDEELELAEIVKEIEGEDEQ